jgi:hypothetical protein
MAKLIKLGEYNKLYKYMWFFIINKLLSSYIFNYSTIPKNLKPFILNSFPKNYVFTGNFFEYISIYLCTFISRRFELKQLKSNESSSKSSSETNTSKSVYNLIYLNSGYSNKKVISSEFFSAIIVLILGNILTGSHYALNLGGLDFWELELLLISLVNSMIFRMPVYRHQKLAIYFIIISSLIIKMLSLKDTFKSEEDTLYKLYVWTIPLGVVSFIFAQFLKAYSFCKAKYFFDLKFITISQFLKFYGLIGSIISILGSIIFTYTKCHKKYKDFPNIKYICEHYDRSIKNGESDNYFDNFKLYFDDWDRNIKSKKVGYSFLFILKNLFATLTGFFTFSIIKNLSPEYYVCANSIYFLIVDLLKFIGHLISSEYEFEKYDMISEIFVFIGVTVYLEIIELNFFKLNYDSKRNISIRSISELIDINVISANDDEDDDE